MPIPILALGGAAVGQELSKKGAGLIGGAFKSIGGAIGGLFNRGGKVLNKTPENSASIMDKVRKITALSKSNFAPEVVAQVQGYAPQSMSKPVLATPVDRGTFTPVKESAFTDLMQKQKEATNTKEMSGLSQFMSGVSGGFTFGQNQKLINVVFWVIAAVALIFVIRPFGILSGSRKKRR